MMDENQPKTQIDSSLIESFQLTTLEIIKSYNVSKAGVFDLLKTEQDVEIKKLLLLYLRDIDESIYNHFENIEDLCDNLAYLHEKLYKIKKSNRKYLAKKLRKIARKEIVSTNKA